MMNGKPRLQYLHDWIYDDDDDNNRTAHGKRSTSSSSNNQNIMNNSNNNNNDNTQRWPPSDHFPHPSSSLLFPGEVRSWRKSME